MADAQDAVDSVTVENDKGPVDSDITVKNSTDNVENASGNSINGNDGDQINIFALTSIPLVHNEDSTTSQKSIVDENRNEPKMSSVEDEDNSSDVPKASLVDDNDSSDVPKASLVDDNNSSDISKVPSVDDDSFEVHQPSSDIDDNDKIDDNTENAQNDEQENNKSKGSDDGDSRQNLTVVDNSHTQLAGNSKNKKKNKVDEISRETQRLIAGNGHVRLPYHKPKQKSLGDFLGRRRHLLADASVTGSHKQLKRAWEMIERKERNVHKFYNDDEVVDDQDSDDDNLKDKDQLDTLDKKPVGNKFMLSKSTLSASVKLTCNDKDVLVSQSLSFKSFADDNGDEGLIVIDDSCKSDPKKRTIKKNLSSHSVARSHVLKHDIWKRVRAAREAGLREVQSDDEDEEEYLLKDENKKSDYEDKAVMDEDEETYDDDEQEEEIDEEDLMDDDYSERKKNNKNGFIDFECEVDSAENVSDSSESDVDDNDVDENSIKKNPLDSSDSDSSTGIKTGVWKSLMSPESAGPIEDGRSSKKKRRPVVLSDSDDDEDTPSSLSESTKLDTLPIFDTEVASTQQLFDLCSGQEFCTQQANSDAASVHDGSSDGFVSDVPGESDIEDSDAEDQCSGGGDIVGKGGIDDVHDGTDNENGNDGVDDDGELGDTESVQGEKAKITDFFDDEAELSEDEEGMWNDEDDEEDEDGADEEDLKMIVNDNGEVDESIRDSLGKIYMRQMLDDDKRQVAELQEMLLEDGDLHNDMGRKRKFQWDDGGDEAGAYKRPLFSSSEEDDDDDNDDGETGKCEIDSEAAWRKERHGRDSYLAIENEDEQDDDAVCQNLMALGTKKTHVVKYQANKTVSANTSVTKVLAEVAVVETSVVQNKDTVEPSDAVEVPTVEIGVKKTNGPIAAVKGSFMMRKGSNSRAAAALKLVDSKKKAMGASGSNDGNTVKQLTTAKASVTNPFAYLLGGSGGGCQIPIDVTSTTEIKTTTTISSSAKARPKNLTSRTVPKKSGGLLKAFLPLE